MVNMDSISKGDRVRILHNFPWQRIYAGIIGEVVAVDNTIPSMPLVGIRFEERKETLHFLPEEIELMEEESND